MLTRKDVIEKAREYVGTPFLHQGRLKKISGVKGCGIDCVGLILCVAEDLALVDKNGVPFKRNDYPEYGSQPVDGFVHLQCVDRMNKKLRTELRPGDVVTLRIPKTPCHVAIVYERNGLLYMIHAYAGGTMQCVEHIMDASWQRRVVGVFEFSGLVD